MGTQREGGSLQVAEGTCTAVCDPTPPPLCTCTLLGRRRHHEHALRCLLRGGLITHGCQLGGLRPAAQGAMIQGCSSRDRERQDRPSCCRAAAPKPRPQVPNPPAPHAPPPPWLLRPLPLLSWRPPLLEASSTPPPAQPHTWRRPVLSCRAGSRQQAVGSRQAASTAAHIAVFVQVVDAPISTLDLAPAGAGHILAAHGHLPRGEGGACRQAPAVPGMLPFTAAGS